MINLKSKLSLLIFIFFLFSLTAFAEKSNLSIVGNEEGEQFASNLRVGDVNNDGYMDLLVSSSNYSSHMREWNGRVSVYFSKSVLDYNEIANLTPDLSFYGSQSGEQLGYGLAVGDLNNDGLNDIVIGADNAMNQRGSRTGKIYIIFGRESFDKNNFDLAEDYDLEIYGKENGDKFGINVEIGDLNADGMSDLLVSSPFADYKDHQNIGKITVFKGGNDFDIEEETEIIGDSTNSMFSAETLVHDIGLNSKNDLIVSAFKYSSSLKKEIGRLYIYKDLDFSKKTISEADIYIDGENDYDWFSFAIKANSKNIYSSSFPFMTARSGEVYKFSLEDIANQYTKIGLVNTDRVNIDSDTYKAASDLEIFDIDNDLKNDLLISAPATSFPSSGNYGRVFVNDADTKIESMDLDDWYAYDIEKIDFNKDGHLDLAVSARYYSDLTSQNIGRVEIIWGPLKDAEVEDIDKVEIDPSAMINRGDFVEKIVSEFDLEEKNKDLLNNCYEYRDFCFYEFSSRTNFNGFQIEPEIILYPDVKPEDEFYSAVNTASILGFVNGYMEKENSPFYPEKSVTRIQALKIILGASDIIEYKQKFELADILGSIEAILTQTTYYEDIDPNKAHMWWYPRYVNFAYENGIIEASDNFRPDEAITNKELIEMLDGVNKYLNTLNEEI